MELLSWASARAHGIRLLPSHAPGQQGGLGFSRLPGRPPLLPFWGEWCWLVPKLRARGRSPYGTPLFPGVPTCLLQPRTLRPAPQLVLRLQCKPGGQWEWHFPEWQPCPRHRTWPSWPRSQPDPGQSQTQVTAILAQVTASLAQAATEAMRLLTARPGTAGTAISRQSSTLAPRWLCWAL